MSDNENDIHVEVDVPPPAEPDATAPDTTVVVVEADPESSTPDGVLEVLLDLRERLTRLEMATVQVAEVAVEADAKAETALAADAEIQAEVLEVQADVQEALEEDQAPPEADEEPRKSHWLHR